MRESYREELDDIKDCLVAMANSVGSQMSTATTALLDADVALADLVIAGDEQIDATRESIDQRCFTLLARQQPVAPDDAERAGGWVGQQHRVVGVDENDGGVHQIDQPARERSLGERRLGRRCAGVGTATDEDGGGHRPTEEETDH